MASFYKLYVEERTSDLVYENNFGFAVYRYVDEKTVYIVDIFIEGKFRRDGHASHIADKIVEEAKEKGCTKLIGTVVPSAKGAHNSLRVLMAYGMKLESAANDLIVFGKEI